MAEWANLGVTNSTKAKNIYCSSRVACLASGTFYDLY